MPSADLSTIHQPVSSAFEAAGLGPHTGLSPTQIADFEQQGFLSGIRVLTPAQVAMLCEELDDLMDESKPDDQRFHEFHRNEASDSQTVLFHALGAWRVAPCFHDLVFLPAIVRIAEQLLGGPVRLWHDQLFVKPPRDGAVVEWHQDYSYWTRTKPVAHLTCWIGLDDSTEENGCIRYIPGSHRWDLLPRYHLSGDMSHVFQFLNDEQRAAFDPFAVILSAGQASFHHPITLHGSYENTSPRPRRAVVINFIRDGVTSDSDEPLLQGIPAIAKGSPLDGQFFPLLSRPT